MLHVAASEVRAPVERIVVEGDEVAWRWRFVGVHTGEFMGVAASGRPIEITGNDMGVLRDGRLTDAWSEVDMFTVTTKVGAVAVALGRGER